MLVFGVCLLFTCFVVLWGVVELMSGFGLIILLVVVIFM